ncbi:uncharacterized protein LOC143889852 isoform X2 [Tasmannia lanceolata]|uniref:uncharacterized protein LOC143889852 isoform X2 n=1 Tax=Tasmannia lanceolata TaxID=3420 RepID=UPI004064AF10
MVPPFQKTLMNFLSKFCLSCCFPFSFEFESEFFTLQKSPSSWNLKSILAARFLQRSSMDSVNDGRRPSQSLSAETLSIIEEGISLIFSRWTVLQMAIQNEWGGRDSREKSLQLASDILAWFAQSKDPHYIDDLEDMIDESMVLSFNAEVEDGSIGEVAEQLMIVHEDCLQGNFESIEKLRKLETPAIAVSQSRQVIDENADESSDEEASGMEVDEQKANPNPKSKGRVVDELKPIQSAEAEEGWSVVSSKRNRGKKLG